MDLNNHDDAHQTSSAELVCGIPDETLFQLEQICEALEAKRKRRATMNDLFIAPPLPLEQDEAKVMETPKKKSKVPYVVCVLHRKANGECSIPFYSYIPNLVKFSSLLTMSDRSRCFGRVNVSRSDTRGGLRSPPGLPQKCAIPARISEACSPS